MRPGLTALCLSFAVVTSLAAADRKVGIVTTVAGVPGVAGFADGPATVATFNRPTWIDLARIDRYGIRSGDIFVVDRVNKVIRRISANAVSTYNVVQRPFVVPTPVSFDFSGPFGGGIVVEPANSGCGGSEYDSGMFVASSGSEQIVMVAMTGGLAARDDVSPLIGQANVPGSADGLAGNAYPDRGTEAQFQTPTGLALSRDYAETFPFGKRRVYVADTGNHTIRQIRFGSSFEGCPQTSMVETIAG
ncbi:MAG: hypothetical protein ACRD3J_18525, partial [Thermoanaerobaculia bacterium]